MPENWMPDLGDPVKQESEKSMLGAIACSEIGVTKITGCGIWGLLGGRVWTLEMGKMGVLVLEPLVVKEGVANNDAFGWG